MGTVAAVGAAAGHVAAQKTTAGIGQTHRPVDKHLQFQFRNRILNRFNLVERSFAAENNSGKTEAVIKTGRISVDTVGLRTEVKRPIGKVLLQAVDQPHIADDKTVERVGTDVIDIFVENRQFAVVKIDIKRPVELPVAL